MSSLLIEEKSPEEEFAVTTSKRSMLVVPPTQVLHSGNLFEISIHRPNASLRREVDIFLKAVIASGSLGNTGNVLIIATCQRAKVDLLQWNEDSAVEKDRLLRTFQALAQDLCEYLKRSGYWADFADPASGLLSNSPGHIIWPEVQVLERLRGYKLSRAGPCHILLHPVWGSRMYPATIFTNAPEAEVKAKLGLLYEDARFGK